MSVHFNDVRDGQCRYPLWSIHERTGPVCGGPTRPGGSYCAHHHALVYEPATPRRIATINHVGLRVANAIDRRQGSANVHPEFEEPR